MLAEEKSVPEEGVFGAGAHSDWGMLTLLKTDSVSGLQVSLPAMPVPRRSVLKAGPNNFLVNV